jgi:antitoxin component of MazEF toxin-antitoxin module
MIVKLTKIGNSKGFIIPKNLLEFYGYSDDIGYALEINSNEIRLKKTDVKVLKMRKVDVVTKKGKTLELKI